jgi:hypothetical protein|uniref:Uncharacterized protein n=1 Tax=viral metagenome TaxID=1070528 RepID=A0A6C0JQ01_9ZZZZ
MKLKLNLTLISILLFIIIILIIFILNNNLEKFIIVKNTDNNKITDAISLPIPEISQVCTGNDCTDILWHKDCNSASYYFDSDCVRRRTYIFHEGKTVSGRDCHLQNYDSGCCEGQGGNGCNCDDTGNTIEKDCNGVCGGTSVIDDCGVCGGDGLSCIEIPPQPSQEVDSPTSKKYINDDCSENSDCYSGICTYKTGEKWPFVKGKTCDGRPYGSPCTDYAKHCIYGHQCRSNTCGPINKGYECDGINDDRCTDGHVCKQGDDAYYCGDDPLIKAFYVVLSRNQNKDITVPSLLKGVKCDGLDDDRCQGGTKCQYDTRIEDYICSADPIQTIWISYGPDSINKNSENCDTESYNNSFSCRDILNIHNTADSILKKDVTYDEMINKLTDDEYTIIKNRLEGYGYIDRCREVCNIE